MDSVVDSKLGELDNCSVPVEENSSPQPTTEPAIAQVELMDTTDIGEKENVSTNLEENVSIEQSDIEVPKLNGNSDDQTVLMDTKLEQIDETLKHESVSDPIDTSSDPITPSIKSYSVPIVLNSFTVITDAWEDLSCDKIENKFTKGCKWAPDGTCILTNSEDNVLRIFNLPECLYDKNQLVEGTEKLPELRQAVSVKEGGTVYDYCWYPCMSSMNPLTCCIASCSRKCPVHLWDAFNGSLRATYNPYNQVDEVEAAYSLAFSPCGQKLYCGFQNSIRIFDLARPGRNCEQRSLKDRYMLPTQRQAGIVSCIAVNPVESKIYALGSYLKTLGLYGEPDGSLLCLLKAHSGGVTHLQFSPDGTKLFSGGRKDQEILCWDLRSPGQLLATLPRTVLTNQRIYFDLSHDGRYLFSGNSTGKVSVYDTLQLSQSDSMMTLPASNSWQAHQDCTNGVSVHPMLPVVATTAGQRHFDYEDDENVQDNISSAQQESCLKMWWVGPTVKQDTSA